jgi:hypothetical protein
MANITIFDLRPVGADLFCDSENYLSELTEEENNLMGGIYWTSYIPKVPPIRFPKFWV